MDFDILFEMVEHFKHFITVFNQCGGGGVVVVVLLLLLVLITSRQIGICLYFARFEAITCF